jgi:general secretion pathway protein D
MRIVAVAPCRALRFEISHERLDLQPPMMIAKLKSQNIHGHQPRLLAMAILLSLLIARSAHSQVPSFPTAAPPNVATGDSKVEAYPLNATTRDVLIAWQQQAAGRTDIRVAIDERTGQALVFAPPAVQAQIHQQLTAKTPAATIQAPAIAAPVQLPNVGLNVPGNAVLFPLRQIPAAELHSRLENVLGRALPATVDASGEWQSFPVEAAPGAGVTMSVNIRSSQVRLDGAPTQVAAWRSVIEALDSPPTTPDRVTKLVATKPNTHDRVRQALQVLQSDSASRTSGSPSLISTTFQPQTGPVADQLAQANAPQQPAGAPATPAAPAPTSQVAPGSAQTAQDAIKLAEAAGGLLGPVQVEFVEGLDVIVLRGSERDVQRVMEIIKQIEDLSAVTVPDIKIHELKFVDSIQMASLLQKVYEQVLGQRTGNITIVPLGTPNALLLIGRTENVARAIELIQQLDVPFVPMSRFEVFPLKHAAAGEAKTLVEEFLGQAGASSSTQQSGGGSTGQSSGTSQSNSREPSAAFPPRAQVVADARTNSLIVIASPRDMAQVAALVQRIDTPGASAELKVFTIVNGDAQALMEMLRSLFSVPGESQNGGGGGGGGGNANNPNSGGGGALGQASPVRMQFSVDTRTNSIVAVGTREDLAVVEAILLRLDEGDLRERQTIVYRLNNAFAQNVAQSVNAWLQTERQNEQQAEITISPFEEIEHQVIVEPELATNSLIVSATPRYFNEVMKVIKDLDERPPMVLIQVLIAQVQLNDTDQFGVELGLQDSVLFDRSLLTDLQNQSITNTSPNGVQTTTQNIISATGTPGFNFNSGQPLGNNVSSTLNTGVASTAGQVGAQGLTNFAVNRIDPTLGFGGFVFSASSNAVNVLLRALQEKRRLEVLSRPQLMALDGQPGQVLVGQNVPTVTGVNQTTFGQTNTIQYREVGLILQVVPRISPDGLVVMQISAEKSQLSAEAGVPIGFSTGGQVLNAPIIDDTKAVTTISATSGQTVVLGGLIETTKNDVHRRVPIIADIPLIGNLFRYDSVQEGRREVLIVLTPQIIYSKMDSDLVKQIESSRMSWILSDVLNVHGEAGLRSRCDEWCDGEMESVFPNFVPEEGYLPLSSHKVGPDGQMEMCAPGSDQSVPMGSTPAPTNSEPLPTPATRQSPGTARPTNEPYKTTDATQPAMRAVSYQTTTAQPVPVATSR